MHGRTDQHSCHEMYSVLQFASLCFEENYMSVIRARKQNEICCGRSRLVGSCTNSHNIVVAVGHASFKFRAVWVVFTFLRLEEALRISIFLFHGTTALSGPGSPHYRSFMITLRHTTLWTSDQPDAETSTLQHTTHNRQICTPAAGFQSADPQQMSRRRPTP